MSLLQEGTDLFESLGYTYVIFGRNKIRGNWNVDQLVDTNWTAMNMLKNEIQKMLGTNNFEMKDTKFGTKVLVEGREQKTVCVHVESYSTNVW
jgi:hypothetical protein